jgi:DNA-binding NarL/FixJ family response regulator
MAADDARERMHVSTTPPLPDDDVEASLDDLLRTAIARVARATKLTAAEVLVSFHAVRGESNKEIGRNLGTSTATVRTQLSSVCRKLSVQTRGQLAYRIFVEAFREHAATTADPPRNIAN